MCWRRTWLNHGWGGVPGCGRSRRGSSSDSSQQGACRWLQPDRRPRRTRATGSPRRSSATAGPDELTGTAGADVIDAGDGDDLVAGLGGNDTICPGLGNDTVDAGPGVDTLVAEPTGPAVTVDLTARTSTGQGSDGVAGFEQVVGTTSGDVLLGSAAADVLRGSGGRDTCTGRAGADTAWDCEVGTVTATAAAPSDVYRFSFAANIPVFLDSVSDTATGGTITWGLTGPTGALLPPTSATVDREVRTVAQGAHVLTISQSGTAVTGALTFRVFASVQTGTFAGLTPGVPESALVNIAQPGRIARWTFAGAAGQAVRAQISSATWPAVASTGQQLRLVDPSGVIRYVANLTANNLIVVNSLLFTGTWTVEVDLDQATTGTALLTVEDPGIQTGTFATLTPASPRAPPWSWTAGERARYTFQGTAGQAIRAQVSAANWPAVASIEQQVRLIDPSGVIRYVANLTANNLIVANSLLFTGTWTVEVDLDQATTGTALLTVEDPGIQTGTFATLTPGVPESATVVLDRPGERARYSFQGTAGQAIRAQGQRANWPPSRASSSRSTHRPRRGHPLRGQPDREQPHRGQLPAVHRHLDRRGRPRPGHHGHRPAHRRGPRHPDRHLRHPDPRRPESATVVLDRPGNAPATRSRAPPARPSAPRSPPRPGRPSRASSSRSASSIPPASSGWSPI